MIYPPMMENEMSLGEDVRIEQLLAMAGKRYDLAYCCTCKKNVEYKLIFGDEYYTGDKYHDIILAQCPDCGNVTTYYEDHDLTIPTKHIKQIRQKIHHLLDPYWGDRSVRGRYYGYMSNKFGYDFHNGELKDDKDADRAYELTLEFLNSELTIEDIVKAIDIKT